MAKQKKKFNVGLFILLLLLGFLPGIIYLIVYYVISNLAVTWELRSL